MSAKFKSKTHLLNAFFSLRRYIVGAAIHINYLYIICQEANKHKTGGCTLAHAFKSPCTKYYMEYIPSRHSDQWKQHTSDIYFYMYKGGFGQR